MPETGYIFNIQRFTVHDGPGIRTTVFFQGCPLDCPWCHNPESKPWAGTGNNREVTGYTADRLMKELRKEQLFFDQSGGGVTFSGGEPLGQPLFLKEVLDQCRKEGIRTSIDTSGYAPEDTFLKLGRLTDLILFDLKILSPEAHYRTLGVPLEPVIRNFRQLDQLKAEVIIRVPLIPGYTTARSNLDQIVNLLHQLHRPFSVQLLPYHRLAESKYRKMGIEPPQPAIAVPGNGEIRQIRDLFRKEGFRFYPEEFHFKKETLSINE
ncbi:MAG: glycyl-radical enzyme activating protein [Bacteroidales bacterium]